MRAAVGHGLAFFANKHGDKHRPKAVTKDRPLQTRSSGSGKHDLGDTKAVFSGGWSANR